MTWNYRVVSKEVGTPPVTLYGVHEVYYDDEEGYITAWTAAPCEPHSSSEDDNPLEAIRWDITMMLKALDEPTLKEEDLPNESP